MNPPSPAAPSGLPPTPCRILVVDADHRVRDSLADLIALADDLDVVGATSHVGETLEAVRRLRPDVVVLDPCLPDPDLGFELLAALRDAEPDLRIVATYRLDHPHAVRIAEIADTCVDLLADSRDFHEAVIAAARGVALAARPSVAESR